MSKPTQTVEELDAVLHWRGKHAQAIRERDALQQRLTAADERADMLARECSDLSAHIALFKSSSMMGSIKVWLDSESAAVANAQHEHMTQVERRADVLEGLLREVQKSARKQDWASGYPTLFASVDAALKPAEGGGDDWKSWAVGNTVRYQGSGQDGEDCYCRMRKGSDYLIHEAPDDHESMVVLDDDGDELCVLVGEFKWIKA